MPRSVEKEIDSLYQRWLEQLPAVHQAQLEGGQTNLNAGEAAWFAIQYNTLNRTMVGRLAAEIDTLRAELGKD